MGGAAGGGKSFGLLLEAQRHIDNPDFGAVIFRRNLVDVKKQGSLLDTSIPLYGQCGGRLRDLLWRFPTRAKIAFGQGLHLTGKVQDRKGYRSRRRYRKQQCQ